MTTDFVSMDKKYFFIVLAISLLTHLLYFGYPKEVVFDEVHFGKFASDYLRGEYFFDIHPPLGKLLLAGAAKTINYDSDFDFATIGKKYPDSQYLILRLIPLLAGIFLGPILYLIAKKLNLSNGVAFLVGFFTSIDSALIVQSRFILLDAILLFFGFASILFFLNFQESRKVRHLAFAGVFAALAASVKWTGLSFLGLMIIFYLIRKSNFKNKFRGIINGLAFLVALPLIIYFFVFIVHFLVLPKSGSGDYFHSFGFQKTLTESKYANNKTIKFLSLPRKFIEENTKLYEVNKDLSAKHSYSSKWYDWPFMIKPIFYWQGSGELSCAKIYFMGNPVIWWSGFLAVAIATGFFGIRIFQWLLGSIGDQYSQGDGLSNRNFALAFGVVGFWLNFLPFAFISRLMFMYHYLGALIFSILILGCLVDRIRNNKKLILFLVFEGALFYFIFFPFIYGISLSKWL